MSVEDVAALGRLLGDTTRVELLDGLFDGRAYTVGELARHVGVAPSTASEHLSKLLDGGLVAVEAQGRHRYYRLRDAQVASVLERLYELGQQRPVRRASQVPAALVYARRCYDHLAGTLAVGLTEHLAATGAVVLVDLAPELTPAGASLFESIGVGSDPAGGRRPPVRRCLDWSERRPHLAGAAPAALLTYMLDQRWLRPKRINRAMELTDAGRAGLQEVFGYRAP